MLRCLYVDLDGTLFGPGGGLFRDVEGGFTTIGSRALEACARAGVEVVVVTGRRYVSAFEDARVLGCGAFVFELGCGLVLDGELEWLTDGMEPSEGAGTIHDQITATGAPELLLEHFGADLEYHTPWSEGRDVSHLFRGRIAAADADAVLAEAGLGSLRLVDNGVMPGGWWPHLGEEVHAYHLLPARASKARGVARHMQNRGYAPVDCIAVGDSREDMEMASAVGAFWLVANGARHDPGLARDAASAPRVRLCQESHGAGVYEAVVSTLATG